jgi:hypothetical protein
VTSAQNKQNVCKRKDNTSGFKGVTFDEQHKKYRARICILGKHIHLGYFETAELASAAYAAAQELHHSHRPV